VPLLLDELLEDKGATGGEVDNSYACNMEQAVADFYARREKVPVHGTFIEFGRIDFDFVRALITEPAMAVSTNETPDLDGADACRSARALASMTYCFSPTSARAAGLPCQQRWKALGRRLVEYVAKAAEEPSSVKHNQRPSVATWYMTAPRTKARTARDVDTNAQAVAFSPPEVQAEGIAQRRLVARTKQKCGTTAPSSQDVPSPEVLDGNSGPSTCADDVTDDEGDSSVDEDEDAICPVYSETAELPSLGSALHKDRTCKRCCFFPKGRCLNGRDCQFCHFAHDKRKPKGKKKKNGRRRNRQVFTPELNKLVPVVVHELMPAQSMLGRLWNY